MDSCLIYRYGFRCRQLIILIIEYSWPFKESERNSNVDLGLFLKNMGGLTLGAYFGIFHT